VGVLLVKVGAKLVDAQTRIMTGAVSAMFLKGTSGREQDGNISPEVS
jgi:hypothetical protein